MLVLYLLVCVVLVGDVVQSVTVAEGEYADSVAAFTVVGLEVGPEVLVQGLLVSVILVGDVVLSATVGICGFSCGVYCSSWD